MAHLTAILNDESRRVPFRPGQSVRDILDATDLRVRCGCRGNGRCGLCLVAIEAGSVNPPTPNERVMLQPRQLEQGVRLACQVIAQQDVRVRIISPAPPSTWRSTVGPEPTAPPDMRRTAEPAFGAAVDLGTTHISLSLWDLAQGLPVAGRRGLNPQAAFGADVVARLVAAEESAETAAALAEAALDGIRDGLMDICSRHGVDAEQIRDVKLVGNTAMLAIITQNQPQALLKPKAWTRYAACPVGDQRAFATRLGIGSHASVEAVAPLAGFVGSDLLAGVLATRLTEQPGGLLIDFGTNSEIALWDGRTLWATSAAGGPAFEGCGIPSGMPAEPGAVYRVHDSGGSGGLAFEVINEANPRGICGSGLVDLIACLLRAGRLTSKGKLAPGDGAFVLGRNEPPIALDTRGVDVFQRAKAAIGVGIRTLLGHAGISARDLTRVFVCGAFGQYLDIRNAQAIGLLPLIGPERFKLAGNTALRGCELLLLSPGAREDLARLRERASLINLAEAEDFDMMFMECLYLSPLEATA